MAILTFLLVGWILSLFRFERLFTTAVREIFGRDVTEASYYFLFLCIGIVGELILLFQGAYYQYFLR